MQKDAVQFLNKQLFETPSWLLDKNILNKINDPVSTEAVANIQTSTLSGLLNAARMNRMSICSNRFGTANTYQVDEMLDDVKKGVWSELVTKKPIDNLRRNLQKTYVETLISIINPVFFSTTNLPAGFLILFGTNVKNTDVPSIVRAALDNITK